MPIQEAQFQSLFRTLVQSLVLALAMAATCATSVSAQDSAEPKRVLIVFANDASTLNRLYRACYTFDSQRRLVRPRRDLPRICR